MTNIELLFLAVGSLAIMLVAFIVIALHFRRRYQSVVDELEQMEIDQLNTHSFGSVKLVDPSDDVANRN